MTKLIALSDGHGIDTAGKRTPILPDGQKSETGNFMHENEFNRAVVKYLDIELKRCGFKTLLVAPTDADTPLEVRTKTANEAKADLYFSVHANANNAQWGSWGGIETYCYPKGESKRVADIVHKHIIGGTPLRDRGVKDGSHLWEIRKTAMPSVLVELGFMDSTTDYKHLLSDAYRKESAVECAKGICEAFSVPYVPQVEVKPANSTQVKVESKTAPQGYKYDINKGKGTLVVVTEKLNLRKGSSLKEPVGKEAKKGDVYYVYGHENGMYNLGGGLWCSSHPDYVKYTKHPEPVVEEVKVEVKEEPKKKCDCECTCCK